MSRDLVFLTLLAVAASYVVAQAIPVGRAPARRGVGGIVVTAGVIALGLLVLGPDRGPGGACLLLVGAILIALGLLNSRGGRPENPATPSNYRIFGGMAPNPAAGKPLVIAGALVIAAVPAFAIWERTR